MTASSLTGRLVMFMLLMGVASSLGQLSTNITFPSFKTLSSNLGAPVNVVQLSVTAFFLAFAATQLAAGFVIQSFGARSMLMTGLAIFAIASLAGALTTGIELFFAIRAAQAFGVGMAVVASRTRIAEMLRGAQRDQAFGIANIGFVVAPAIAPILGVYLEQNLSWRWGFCLVGGTALLVLTLYAIVDKGRQATVPEPDDSPIAGPFLLFVLANIRYVVSSALMYGGLFAMLTMFPTEAGIDSEHIGYFTSGAMVLIAVASALTGVFSRSMGSENLYRRCMYVTFFVVMLAITARVIALDWSWRYTLLAPFLFAIGIIVPLSVSLYLSSLPRPGLRASIIGSFHLLGGAAGSMLAAYATRTGVDVTGSVAFLSLLALLAYWPFGRRSSLPAPATAS